MKTNFKYIVLLMFVLVIRYQVHGQIAPLKIGDKVPDIVLKNILGQEGEIQLSSLHQQDLLIVNFWATWCVACINELPVLDSLAAKYPKNLKVLSVAYESSTKVRAFLRNHSQIPISHLHIVTDDKVLIEFFKHRVIPHNVWIDRNGIIKNITGGEEVNSKNIEVFISKASLSVHNKIDKIQFDMWQPFHLKDTDFLYRSILSGFTEGINGGVVSQAVWKHPTERWFNRIFNFNVSLQQLLWCAYSRSNNGTDYYGIMKFETDDSTRFFWPDQCRKTFSESRYKSVQEWQKENTYCYELTLPDAADDTTIYSYMMSDILKVFHLNASVRNDIIPTCVLTLENSKEPLNAKQNDSSYIDISSTRLVARNVKLIYLYQYLNERIKANINSKPVDPPYIDETHMNYRIDLEIEFDKTNPNFIDIKNMIKNKYGISADVVNRPYPVVYIKRI